jgi:hypothetical protein
MGKTLSPEMPWRALLARLRTIGGRRVLGIST